MFIHYELNGASGRVGRIKPAGYSEQKGHFAQSKLMEGLWATSVKKKKFRHLPCDLCNPDV